MTLIPDFEEALNDLLATYDTTPLDQRISALELALYTLKEEERNAETPDED